MVMFSLLQRLGENRCFRCGDAIVSAADLTMDHKEPWENRDVAAFWALENIAFSHPGCNRDARDTQNANSRKTHCRNGHPFDAVRINGERACRRCERDQKRRERSR